MGLLVSSAAEAKEAKDTEQRSSKLKELAVAVDKQLDSYPDQDLQQLPVYASRLQDTRLKSQAEVINFFVSKSE